MRYVKQYKEALDLFKALGSEVRIEILKLLIAKGRMSLNEITEALQISNGALTPHIRKLETSGLIRIHANTAGHGNIRICEPNLTKILFRFSQGDATENVFRSHLRVGQYSKCHVYPTCGLSTTEALIGEADNPRYFTDSRRFQADILWFTMGYVEYMVPCVIPSGSRIEQLQVSAELSSEAPGSNANWPSDISFSVNGTPIGSWVSPGDFADVPGLFTPDWWFSNWNQYGLLKTLTIRSDGTFLDAEKISDVVIDDLKLRSSHPIYFRFAVSSKADHIGGLTIFGRDFGNYNQDIEFRITYSPEVSS